MRPIGNAPSLAALSVLALLLTIIGHKAVADPQSGAFEATSVSVTEINLDGLRSSLRETDAIGFTTKLSLKHDLDTLLESFHEYHQGKSEETLPTLRERFAELLSATLAMLKDDDPKLFRRLWDAQGHLWLTVSDPVQFHAAVTDEKNDRVAFQKQD